MKVTSAFFLFSLIVSGIDFLLSGVGENIENDVILYVQMVAFSMGH